MIRMLMMSVNTDVLIVMHSIHVCTSHVCMYECLMSPFGGSLGAYEVVQIDHMLESKVGTILLEGFVSLNRRVCMYVCMYCSMYFSSHTETWIASTFA